MHSGNTPTDEPPTAEPPPDTAPTRGTGPSARRAPTLDGRPPAGGGRHIPAPHRANASPGTEEPPPSKRAPLARTLPRRADVAASVTVFLIAIPLSLGIALATGAPLQAGLVAAAVGGLVVGTLGGAPLQVSGPAAGLTVVVADLINTYGWRTTCAITVLAGLSQLVLGSVRIARAALAVSPAIIHGMLAGIGVTVALAQAHVVLGGAPEDSALANITALPGQLLGHHAPATTIGLLTAAVLLLWPRLPGRWGAALRKVPGALAAVALATTVAIGFGLDLALVELPSWNSHALPETPRGPALGLVAAVLTVTLVASVESLLSAVAIDRLHHGPRANLDRELLGQGAGNVVSGALGGLPITGVAVRSTANVRAGAQTRASAVLHGCWVVLCVGLFAALLERIPLAALAALVLVVGVQMVNLLHMRHVWRHREFPVYLVTVAGVILGGVLEGVALGVAVAMGLALHRLARTRVVVAATGEFHHVQVRGQLTFLSVPRLSRALGRVPEGGRVTLELRGSFMDHAASESLRAWQTGYTARGGSVEVCGYAGDPERRDVTDEGRRPWTSWATAPRDPEPPAEEPASDPLLLGGVSAFQRHTAPLVRADLARLAREGQHPSQLFLTCADSRLVTSMITSSGPGDLFTVRNVGNLVPLPGEEVGDDSVAAAIEYAVEVLRVTSVTVCGHSGCGAMQALVGAGTETGTPLARWLRHGLPGLDGTDRAAPRLDDRPTTDRVERLALVNVVRQLDHLRAHDCVGRRLQEGGLRLTGMYFDIPSAQVYVFDPASDTFQRVRPDLAVGCRPG
ncbi:transporter [Wenjunlia vitaminophila]|uniref:Transporter n=1 Tax=Wenjunlia vitaminophila TaxID=76728 RepID=A0A0T6LN99_WENVI|nr:SulP family inorganic anion transporter [Wenjunlia vitaminophila]KRV47568.1 transporter [Wenjunlia vitaminophila]